MVPVIHPGAWDTVLLEQEQKAWALMQGLEEKCALLTVLVWDPNSEASVWQPKTTTRRRDCGLSTPSTTTFPEILAKRSRRFSPVASPSSSGITPTLNLGVAAPTTRSAS